eukprot:scaffold4872_cov17-Tisochrysis_lutea.AAC.1
MPGPMMCGWANACGRGMHCWCVGGMHLSAFEEGRAAMLGFAFSLVGEILTGKGALAQLGYEIFDDKLNIDQIDELVIGLIIFNLDIGLANSEVSVYLGRYKEMLILIHSPGNTADTHVAMNWDGSSLYCPPYLQIAAILPASGTFVQEEEEEEEETEKGPLQDPKKSLLNPFEFFGVK